ncbi:hypothetical protein BB560_001443 [Smittium megazygosporum]|uniref:histone deacetylase n=1 Tax=Smittium megazygosporum TaxID=133381 RepID=A0A2T9ZHI2_9FUNG|nr:hypothetical protein BB560_001443 [Smittium megazygosporum]
MNDSADKPIFPKVGYIFDSRFKAHRELVDNVYLDSIDIRGNSLRELEKQKRERFNSKKSHYNSWNQDSRSSKYGWNKKKRDYNRWRDSNPRDDYYQYNDSSSHSLQEKAHINDDPDRAFAIFSILESSGYLKNLIKVKSNLATYEQITAVHSEDHYKTISSTSIMEENRIIEAEAKYDSVFFNRDTFYCAKLCAGSVTQICLETARGNIDSGFAITRPP